MTHTQLTPGERAIIEAIERVGERHTSEERQKHAENQRQILAIIEAQRRMQDDLASISKGFPDGDPDSHRRYHESIIAWRELRNELVRGALTNASKVGFLAALAWIGYAVWVVIKMEFTK